MPKSPTDFQRATDSEVGGVYFMVLNSQPFWLVLRWQKCVLENFGSILRVQSWVEKDFGGRLGDFFAKLFVKSKLFFEDHGWMNQWTWIDWSDWICSFVQSFPDRFYMDSSKTEMQRKDQARRVLASQGWLEIGKGTEWNSLINIYIYTHHVISCHIISYHIISYHIISYHIMIYSDSRSCDICKGNVWNWNNSLEWKTRRITATAKNCKDAWIEAQFEALKKRCLVWFIWGVNQCTGFHGYQQGGEC